jgi:hypothetical protein
MTGRLRRGASIFLVAASFVALGTHTVHAETLSSNSYRFEESIIGSGGVMESSSANYRATDVLGDVAIGSAASTNFQVHAGSKTSPDPALTVKINTSSTSFGSFSATSPSMATSSFSVLNYTAFGYVVQIEGDPPKKGNRTIPALANEESSQVGTEQFGMNLVANTSPQSIGSNPDQGQFGFGEAHTDYATPNKFRYRNGDVIASAPKSSGETNFTISYLVNVAPLTEGGSYRTNQTIIVIGTY